MTGHAHCGAGPVITQDGREELLRLSLPLPAALTAELLDAVEAAARRLGYTDIAIDFATRAVVASPPPQLRRRILRGER